MSIEVLLITHDDIGTALLKAARKTYGHLPINARVIPVSYSADPEELIPQLQQIASALAKDKEILILTDLYGSTPCNIAMSLQNYPAIRVISGLNLPMLLKVMNYPDLTLEELAEKALSGGRDGVVDCSSALQEQEHSC